jgi:hypothetical protein
MSPEERPPSRWPLERALFALTAAITLLSVGLGAFVSRWFLLAAVLVGVGQWLYVTVGDCPGAMLLRRGFRLRSAIYANETVPAEKPVVRAAT